MAGEICDNWDMERIIGTNRAMDMELPQKGQCPAQWPYLELFSLCGAFPEGADTPGGARASSGVPMEGGALAGRSPPSRIAGPRKPRNVGAARLWETPMILWRPLRGTPLP